MIPTFPTHTSPPHTHTQVFILTLCPPSGQYVTPPQRCSYLPTVHHLDSTSLPTHTSPLTQVFILALCPPAGQHLTPPHRCSHLPSVHQLDTTSLPTPQTQVSIHVLCPPAGQYLTPRTYLAPHTGVHTCPLSTSWAIPHSPHIPRSPHRCSYLPFIHQLDGTVLGTVCRSRLGTVLQAGTALVVLLRISPRRLSTPLPPTSVSPAPSTPSTTPEESAPLVRIFSSVYVVVF